MPTTNWIFALVVCCRKGREIGFKVEPSATTKFCPFQVCKDGFVPGTIGYWHPHPLLPPLYGGIYELLQHCDWGNCMNSYFIPCGKFYTRFLLSQFSTSLASASLLLNSPSMFLPTQILFIFLISSAMPL